MDGQLMFALVVGFVAFCVGAVAVVSWWRRQVKKNEAKVRLLEAARDKWKPLPDLLSSAGYERVATHIKSIESKYTRQTSEGFKAIITNELPRFLKMAILELVDEGKLLTPNWWGFVAANP